MVIKNILFDLGGVLIELDRQAAVDRFAELGYPQADALLDPYKQSGIFLQLEEGKVTPQQLYDRIRNEGGSHITPAQIDDALARFLVRIPDYKLEMLLDLRRHFRVYMLSNTNEIMFEYAVRTWFSKGGHKLGDYFDHCFLSYEMKMVKPSPEIFENIAAYGLVPSETLFLDDGKANIDEAARQGFQARLVGNGEDYRYLFKDI